MADTDQAVLIQAFVRWGQLKGRQVIECLYEEAIMNTVRGVSVTSVTYEGASGSGVVNNVSTDKLLVILEQVLQIMDGDDSNNRAVHALFDDGFIQT